MAFDDAFFETHEITIDGVTMQYLTAGQGDPLVFFHGAGLIGGWDFARPWAEHFRVILPFHPGWGGSDDAPHFTAAQHFVDHHLAFVNALVLETFNLIGFSMGGWIASCFAAQHADRIKRLVLVAPAGLRDDEHPGTDLFAVQPEDVLPYLAHDLNAFAPYAPADPAAPDFLTGLYRDNSSFAQLGWERMWEVGMERKLPRITPNTLLLWGDMDRVVPFGQAGRWAALLPKARIHRLKDVGHYPFLEDPEAHRVVTQFLTQDQ